MQEQGLGSKSGFRSFSLARETSVQPLYPEEQPRGVPASPTHLCAEPLSLLSPAGIYIPWPFLQRK